MVILSSLTDDGTFSTTGGATGGSFGAGMNVSTVVSGTGTGASVSLAVGGGTGANGAYSCASGTCNLAGATYNYTTFNISAGATVNVTGTTALIIKATGNVTIAGTLNLNGGNGGDAYGCGEDDCPGAGGVPGAGGYWGGGGGVDGSGAGYGRKGVAPAGNFSGGGGGGYGGAGGNGYQGAVGGSIYSTETGGSGGGGGYSTSGGGGGGGGYLKISSNGNISNTGTINANGGNGGAWASYAYGGGGGGSGGRINLIAQNISNSGSINAKGGNGYVVSTAGGGGGGGGRIVLQDSDGVVGGTLSVVYGTSCTSTSGCTNAVIGVTSASTLTYVSSGTFTSAAIDLGSSSVFGALTFTSTIPAQTQTSCTVSTGAGCAVKIQVAANTDNATWNYVGPDGTTATYFTQQAGEMIPSSLNNNRYLRYRAYLATVNTAYTPVLDDVTVGYENSANYNFTLSPSPASGEVVAGRSLQSFNDHRDGSESAGPFHYRPGEFFRERFASGTINFIFTNFLFAELRNMHS